MGETPNSARASNVRNVLLMKGNGTSPPKEWTKNSLEDLTVASPRMLVVEDDISLSRLNPQLLVFSGLEVDAAAQGAVPWQALTPNYYLLSIVKKVFHEGDRKPVEPQLSMKPNTNSPNPRLV